MNKLHKSLKKILKKIKPNFELSLKIVIKFIDEKFGDFAAEFCINWKML